MTLNCQKLFMFLSIITLLFVQSCSDSDNPSPVKPGAEGFFIINEGGFPNDNSSVSFYDRTTDAVTNDVFFSVNGRKLGVQAQSLTVIDGKAYIMVQGSQKIEVINADNYSSVSTITEGIESPRYMIPVSSTKAYVSDWGEDGVSGSVKVLDLTTNKVIKTIATGKGANKMLKVDNSVYVANSGGYDTDNTIKVIDVNTDAIVSSITVGSNPNSIQRDASGNIWVSSSGNTVFIEYPTVDEANSTKGSISKINGNTEVLRLEVDGYVYGGVSNLAISPDEKTLYYTFNGSVYAMNTTATALPTTPLLADKYYYGFSVDPFNGNLIGGVAPNFSSAGSIEVMAANGTPIKTHTVGIGPNGVAFK